MPGTKPEVRPVKLIAGVLFQTSLDMTAVDRRLTLKFGPIDCKSDIFDFTFTDYYRQEMGDDLKKQFYSFQRLIHPETLPGVKKATIEIESDFSEGGKRSVNIDPGYLEESKLVLASTKNFSHRIYLGDSIWGEVTLRLERGKFLSHPWTYADYKQVLASQFFLSVREIYRKQLDAFSR